VEDAITEAPISTNDPEPSKNIIPESPLEKGEAKVEIKDPAKRIKEPVGEMIPPKLGEAPKVDKLASPVSSIHISQAHILPHG
jgi:hypothetical protein